MTKRLKLSGALVTADGTVLTMEQYRYIWREGYNQGHVEGSAGQTHDPGRSWRDIDDAQGRPLESPRPTP